MLPRSAYYATTMGDETSTSVAAQPQEPAAAAAQGAGSVKQKLPKLVVSSLQATVPEVEIEPMVEVCTAKFGDYQRNNAMGLWSRNKGFGTSFKNPNAIGRMIFTLWSTDVLIQEISSSRGVLPLAPLLAIAKNLPPSDIIESTSVAGPGFVNIVLFNSWVAKVYQPVCSDHPSVDLLANKWSQLSSLCERIMRSVGAELFSITKEKDDEKDGEYEMVWDTCTRLKRPCQGAPQESRTTGRGNVVARPVAGKHQLGPDSSVLVEMTSEMASEDGREVASPGQIEIKEGAPEAFPCHSVDCCHCRNECPSR